MSKEEIIEKEITVNVGTLEAYGSYVDKMYIPEKDLHIRLIVKKEPQREIKGEGIGVLTTKTK